MSADDKDAKGWGRRLDGLIKRVGDEVGGERGEKVRRLRGEVTALGDKAMDRVDDALRHERTQAVVRRVDAALTEVGDRLRGDPTERTAQAPVPTADEAAARADEMAAEADETAAKADELAAEADKTASRADEMAAEADETAAKADELAAEADKTASRADEMAAEADETASRADEMAAEADETASRADEMAAEADETASRADEMAAEADETAATPRHGHHRRRHDPRCLAQQRGRNTRQACLTASQRHSPLAIGDWPLATD